MLEEGRMLAVEDKAIFTSHDASTNLNNSDLYDGRSYWNVATMEKLINTLINNKLLSIKAMESMEVFDQYDESESSIYSLAEQKEKEPPDKKPKMSGQRDSREQKHCSHCPKHPRHEEKREHRSSISKVQKWSDEYDMETSFYNKSDEELRVSSQERVATKKMKSLARDNNEIDESQDKPRKKRKRKRRKKSEAMKKNSQIDPEDLPRRARWTIIITSGLLILTCMFLVGITLRMAPVIDQMVRTKNEELMNSLNRDTSNNPNPAYYSADMWEKSPRERAKQKYG